MALNSRLSVAAHALALLALRKETSLTSAEIAESVNTNPVVIRRLMSLLRRANIVRSRGGVGGGWELVGDADSINLLAVRNAVESTDVFVLHRRRPNERCPVGCSIEETLTPVYRKAAEAAERELAKTTIGAILESTLAHTSQKKRTTSKRII